MYTATILACLALAVPFAWASGHAFCYDEEDCGPRSADAWSGQCQSGERQTPIDLPLFKPPTFRPATLQLSAYRGDHFRMQNTGHSVSVDFDSQGPSSQLLTFPDPLDRSVQRQYRFSSAHFHWGSNDKVGSEHTIGGRSSAMEMHLVHYNANYSSQAEAVASGDENALTVVGLLINTPSLLSSMQSRNQLSPIASNIESVHEAEHDTTQWTTVNEPLDLSKMLFDARKLGVYTYKGSLTTPGCNEQVNWYVLRDTASANKKDIAEFRTILDGREVALTENHRPIMPTNGRQILYSMLNYQ